MRTKTYGIVHFLRVVEGKPPVKPKRNIPDLKAPWPGSCTPSTLHELCQELVEGVYQSGDYFPDHLQYLADRALTWDTTGHEDMWHDLYEGYIHPEIIEIAHNWYERMEAGDWPNEEN